MHNLLYKYYIFYIIRQFFSKSATLDFYITRNLNIKKMLFSIKQKKYIYIFKNIIHTIN